MSKEFFEKSLLNILKRENVAEKFVKYAKEKEKKVFLFGGGHACEYFINYLQKRDVSICAIIDKKRTEPIQEIPCYTLEVIKKLYDIENAVFVISVPSVKNEIMKELLEYVDENQVFYFEVELYEYYGSCYDRYKDYLIQNMEELACIYSELSDDYSRQTMIKVIEGRLTGDLDSVSNIWVKDQYWPNDIIQFTNKETIIECGSCDGKNLIELCDKLGKRFSHIYCFEPDKDCKEILSKVIEDIDADGRVTYIEKGTYKESTTLSFTNEGIISGLSKIDVNGRNVIEVVAIDDEINDKISYIKMDIEGAELDTLIGAKRIITENKPKLAICIYHKDSDIIDIMKYLKSLNLGYRFYIRHHNCNMTETVLYAI